MNNSLKYIVLLVLIWGIIHLISNELPGWGWLIFLFVLTLITPDHNKEDNDGNERIED
jgi:hypothetical protein